jgi:hypothetical protein
MSTGSGDLTTECQQALNEVNVMLRYALAKGLALDVKTQATIASFKSCEPGESATPNFTTILAAHTLGKDCCACHAPFSRSYRASKGDARVSSSARTDTVGDWVGLDCRNCVHRYHRPIAVAN